MKKFCIKKNSISDSKKMLHNFLLIFRNVSKIFGTFDRNLVAKIQYFPVGGLIVEDVVAVVVEKNLIHFGLLTVPPNRQLGLRCTHRCLPWS